MKKPTWNAVCALLVIDGRPVLFDAVLVCFNPKKTVRIVDGWYDGDEVLVHGVCCPALEGHVQREQPTLICNLRDFVKWVDQARVVLAEA